MGKKFLWAFYAILVLCSLKNISQASTYMDDFELEVVRVSNLTCKFSLRTQWSSYMDSSRRKVEVGSSVGPLGTTTHYEYTSAPIERQNKMESYKCNYCGYDKGPTLGWIFYPSVPTITIEKDDNFRTMTINVGFTLRDVSSDLPICNSIAPHRPLTHSYKMQNIWERAGLKTVSYYWAGHLQTLWEAARQLDLENGEDVANIKLFVRQRSTFSPKEKALKKKEEHSEDEEKKASSSASPVYL